MSCNSTPSKLPERGEGSNSLGFRGARLGRGRGQLESSHLLSYLGWRQPGRTPSWRPHVISTAPQLRLWVRWEQRKQSACRTRTKGPQSHRVGSFSRAFLSTTSAEMCRAPLKCTRACWAGKTGIIPTLGRGTCGQRGPLTCPSTWVAEWWSGARSQASPLPAHSLGPRRDIGRAGCEGRCTGETQMGQWPGRSCGRPGRRNYPCEVTALLSLSAHRSPQTLPGSAPCKNTRCGRATRPPPWAHLVG